MSCCIPEVQPDPARQLVRADVHVDRGGQSPSPPQMPRGNARSAAERRCREEAGSEMPILGTKEMPKLGAVYLSGAAAYLPCVTDEIPPVHREGVSRRTEKV